MCNKGSSPPVPNQTSTAFQSATAPSSFVMPYYQQYVQNASQLAGTPFNPAMMGNVAPLGPNQYEAGATIQSIMQNMPGYVGDVRTAGANMGTFDPNAVHMLESPYTEDVVNATQNWFNNQNAIQGNDLLGSAIKSGNAFGGDRAGVAEAQLGGQQQLAQAPVIAGLREKGYSQALNEYNMLKQMGLAGAQAGLGAAMSQLTPAAAALQWGNQAQQQQQREFDVAQQNAMMASAYPFQIANWYGSALGGMGPLMGSSAIGYTTPPEPSLVSQIGSIAGPLAGAISAFTNPGQKRGGVVGRRRVGGLVNAVPMLRGGFVVPGLARGGIIVPIRMLSGGFLKDGTYVGNDSDDDDHDDADKRQAPTSTVTGGGSGAFNIGQLHLPRRNVPTADVAGMMRQSQQKKDQQPQQGLAGDIAGLANIAKATAPLFALLERGGAVHHYDDGGDVDDDDEEDTDDTEDAAIPVAAQATAGTTAVAQPPPMTNVRPAPGDTSVWDAVDRATLPRMGTPEANRATPTPQQERVYRQAPPQGGLGRERDAYAADRGPGPTSTRTIPGLGAPPRGFIERWLTNPLTQAGAAMGASRSPYWSVALGAGFQGGAAAAERERKQELLDNHPQMIDDGESIKFRSGNRIIDTGLRSAKGNKLSDRMAIEEYKQEQANKRNQARIDARTGTGDKRSITQEGLNQRNDMRMIQKQIDAAMAKDPTLNEDQVAYDIIDKFNKRYGRNYPLPEVAPKKEETTKAEGPGVLQRIKESLFGGKPSTSKGEATAKPEEGATAPPAQQQQQQQQSFDLGTALKQGTMTPQAAKDQAREMLNDPRVRNNPAKRQAIFDRLKAAGIDFSDLISGSVVPQSR